MVNIFSFFTRKKQSKRASWAGAPSSGQPDLAASAVNFENVSPAVKLQTSRFLSLRTRSSARRLESPKDNPPGPRRSSESLRRRARRPSSVGPLPRLEVSFGPVGEVDDDVVVIPGPSLGLDDYGQTPQLTPKEIEVIRKVKLSVDEVRACWQLFGKHLKQTGCETIDIMLPDHRNPDPTTVRYLIALFLLHQRPAMGTSFPTINARIAQLRPATLFSLLLDSSLMGDPGPHELCEVLVFALQHLSHNQPSLIDSEMYKIFVQAEHKARYPLDAYTTLLLPRLPQGVGAYLDTIFDVFAEIASKSQTNVVWGGKLCLVYGRTIWGINTNKRDWEYIYREWQFAGRRLEHLFCAWIRSQSTKMSLPTRLLELVVTYPPGDPAAESGDFLEPSPSTFSRSALHVNLQSEIAHDRNPSPLELLDAALEADARDMPMFAALQHSIQSLRVRRVDMDTIAPNSRAFLERFRVPRASAAATNAFNQSDGSHETESSAGRANGPARETVAKWVAQTSHATNGDDTSSTQQPLSWDDFRQTGFGDELRRSHGLELATHPPPRPATLSGPVVEERIQQPVPRPINLTATFETIHRLDDAFLPFCETTQLASPDSILAGICLVRLATVRRSTKWGNIDWLLVSVYRSHASELPTSEAVPAETGAITVQPASPAQNSTRARLFDLAGLVGSIRRSASSGTMSHGSASRPVETVLARHGLDPISEAGMASGSGRAGASKTKVQTGASVGTVIAAKAAPAQMEPGGPVETTSSGKESAAPGPTASAVNVDKTPITDWHYVAEGGANIVFGYHGKDAMFIGRAIRIPKSGSIPDEEALADRWREDLLSRLLPSRFLVRSERVTLDWMWFNELCRQVEEDRPGWRLESHDNGGGRSAVAALLMDDLRSGPRGSDQKMFAIEIKPKWGFLPLAKYITPPEAKPIKSTISRYTLHQHLRGKESVYEPLDLFSSQPTRMGHAILSLWHLWHESEGGVNSWRVFVDGKLVTPADADAIPGPKDQGHIPVEVKTLPLLLSVLRDSGVLDHVRRLQSRLAPYDISHLAKMFTEQYLDTDLFEPEIMPEHTVDDLEDIVDVFGPTKSTLPDLTLSKLLQAYALAATFMDCSIFLTCPMVPDGNGWKAVMSECTAKVIDLDLKPVKNMKKWYELDEKIWRHWHATHPSSLATNTTSPPDDTVAEATSAQIPRDLMLSPPTRPTTAQGESGLDASSTRAMFVRTPGGTPMDESGDALARGSGRHADGHDATPELSNGHGDTPATISQLSSPADQIGSTRATAKRLASATNSRHDPSPPTADSVPKDSVQHTQTQRSAPSDIVNGNLGAMSPESQWSTNAASFAESVEPLAELELDGKQTAFRSPSPTVQETRAKLLADPQTAAELNSVITFDGSRSPGQAITCDRPQTP